MSTLVDELVARVLRERERFGIARETRITRLDRLDIPVVSVTRADPIGESVSVSSGCGFDESSARLSALAEAVERRCGEPRPPLPVVDEPGEAEVELESLILTTPSSGFDGPWSLGTRCGEPVAVPSFAVYFPWFQPALFAPTTTGLAFGVDRADAVRRGLLEVIERDAFSRVVCMLVAGKDPSHGLVEPTSDRLSQAIAHASEAGMSVLLRDVTGEIAVPTVHCVVSEQAAGGPRTHEGIATRSTVQEAAERAFLEAVQSRAVDIQGAREDLEPSVVPHTWFTQSSERPAPPRSSADPDQALEAAGFEPPIVVDLAGAEPVGHVVRVIVPGAENCAADPERLGRRALSWAH